MCDTTWLNIVFVRITPYSWPSMLSGWLIVCSLSLFLALFFSVCLSFTLLFSSHFYLYSVLNLFFPVENAKANIPCASVKRGVLLPWQNSLFSQITGKRFWKSIFYVCFTQRLSPKNSIWRRSKKPRRSPWSRKDEDYSHKWRQTKSRHNSNADICNKAVDYEFHSIGGITAELHGRTAKKTAKIGIAIRQIPQSTVVFSVEFRFKTQGHYLFWFSIGCYVVDQKKWRWFIHWMNLNPRD